MFRGPDIDAGADLYHAMADAMYGVHTFIRNDRETCWVMSRDWYDRLRAKAYELGDREDPEPDPEKRVPQPGDQILGIKMTVTEDGGPPHLENPRYPQDWEPIPVPWLTG